MNVYVESNFVLELALERQQHESCRQLLQFSSAGSVNLIVPAFSLAEPHDVLTGNDRTRRKLSNDLKTHLDELGRSEQYRQAPDAFRHLARTLFTAGEIERDGLQRTLRWILEDAQVIPLNSDILESAGDDFEGRLGLPAKDAIVLASVQSHLEETLPDESCFLNRNTKDFDSVRVREVLDIYHCKFFGNFDDGLRHIASRLRPS